MRRFHNPRFAPESLERKLSPTAMVPVAAQVYVLASANTVAFDVPDDDGDDTDPGDGDGSPPPIPPSNPDGPPIP